MNTLVVVLTLAVMPSAAIADDLGGIGRRRSFGGATGLPPVTRKMP